MWDGGNYSVSCKGMLESRHEDGKNVSSNNILNIIIEQNED